MVFIKLLMSSGRRMDEHSGNFDIENMIKYQVKVTEVKKTINELKNIIEGFNKRLDGAEEMIN